LEEKEEDPCPKLGVSQLPSRHSSSIADWLAVTVVLLRELELNPEPCQSLGIILVYCRWKMDCCRNCLFVCRQAGRQAGI
jgi:hypothetical protein